MTAGTRMPSLKEKEKNKRRERIRRAIAANIYAGLRKYGNYNLPKHCDNNQVLKALCDEAGWSVEPDGTTYRKGCKPLESMEVTIASTSSASPYSLSYQPSPFTSYNPSPASSSLASPSSHNNNKNKYIADANSLIPWLKNLSSNPMSSSSKPPRPNHLFVNSGSLSAPVTPGTSSPRFKASVNFSPNWLPQYDYAYPSSSFVSSNPSSPTFSLVSPSSGAFGFSNSGIMSEGSSRMCTPSQSGMCSPNNAGDVRMKSDEFAFNMLKAWEGETIHEECGDDLELTLGTSKTRA